MKNHTPTPWKLAMFNTKIVAEGKVITRMTSTESLSFNKETTNDNALYIVHCVNSHENLINLCQELIDCLYDYGKDEDAYKFCNKLEKY